MKKKEIIFVLTDGFADWESAYLSSVLHDGIYGEESDYVVKTLTLDGQTVQSTGGFHVLSDYTISKPPTEYSALILVGSKSWRTDEVKQLLPLIKQTLANKLVLGAICDATVFLGMNGFLNNNFHTSNTLAELKKDAGNQYNNSEQYLLKQAVSDGKIVTGNGSATLAFTVEVLRALNAFSEEAIVSFYNFYKDGYYQTSKELGLSAEEPFK